MTHPPPKIRNVVLAALAGTFFASPAGAQQIDVAPPLPNAVILLDTSGSMEKMIDGQDPESVGATCNPGVATTPNRWGTALQALTGDIAPYYSCWGMSRAKNSTFDNEYKLNGQSVYDVDYFLPYHRPVSGDSATTACVYAPGTLPGSSGGQGVGTPAVGTGGLPSDFPSGSIITRLVSGNAGTCNFAQSQNGVLDSARDMIRFGIMTFDSETDPKTGVNASATSIVDPPFTGQWSYYSGWNSNGGTPKSGNPADCSASSLFEVGARNPAAPPWEGRFVMLPDPAATLGTIQTHNDQIQLVVNASRPNGATPIAGMFDDARYYYWTDPLGPQQNDAYVQGNCRDEYIILITDGAPNLDLRPSCGAAAADPSKPGLCPYELPEDIAQKLATGGSGKHVVKTFVIGFAVSSIQDGSTIVKCSDLVTGGTLSSACSDPSKQSTYGACCTLQKIAIAGATTSAYFADTAGDLNKALGAIMASIAKNVTTRTVPAYSPVVANPSVNPSTKVTNSSLYLSSFSPIPGKPWVGTVQRQRYVCTFGGGTYTVPPPVIDPAEGDDFAFNLNLSGTQANRQFRSVLADTNAGVIDSTATLRVNIAATLPGVHGTDNFGTYSGTLVGTSAATIRSSLTAAALNISATSCSNSLNNQWLTAASCKNLALNFAMAEPTSDAMPDYTFPPFQARTGFAMGDIFHASPVVIPPPAALVRDESYNVFAATNATRKTVLYAATNDGLLHAFDTDVDKTTREQGELWAFMPPAVLPKLLSTYPASHQLLLDGAPVVKDVIWDRDKGSSSLLAGSNWHTTLVAGFGSGAPGYYALDVTDPAPSTDLTKGPKFLWQLTSAPKYAGNPQRELFANHGATPAITTVFVDLDSTAPHEVGVAILPGGSMGGPVGGSCARLGAVGADAAPPTGFTRRDNVRCWANSGEPVIGRSVTIVRLDTGEVLRVFGRAADMPEGLTAALRVGEVETPLDSPMTGIPVVYPQTPGSVAQKVFIGDADGTIWRFDLTNTNPQKWKGELFVDAYNQDTVTGSGAYAAGQPIALAPVVSVDRTGAVVLNFATGDQETYTATGTNFVYSVSEKIDTVSSKLRANVNWYLPFASGERVSGPMTVFDATLYFSTFAAGAQSNVCKGGVAKMFGRDFVIPKDATDLSKGGMPRLQPPVSPTSPPPDFIIPANYDATLDGKLIPGVSINVTPACADTSASLLDTYTGGLHTIANYVTPGSFSLLAQVGGKNGGSGGGAGATFSVSLPTPRSASVVDSWAAVVE